jgi:hypothetical protein
MDIRIRGNISSHGQGDYYIAGASVGDLITFALINGNCPDPATPPSANREDHGEFEIIVRKLDGQLDQFN